MRTDIVIVLAISPSTGEIQYASYGRDKTLCNMGKVFATAHLTSA